MSDIKEEDNGSQTIRRFKYGEVIDLSDEEYKDEKIEEKIEENGYYGNEVMEVKSETGFNIQQIQLKADAIFLSQDDLKRLALQHLENQDLFAGSTFEIEAPQTKLDGFGSSNKRQKDTDSEDEEGDRQIQNMISNLKKKVLHAFKTQPKEKMMFTIGFKLTRSTTSKISLLNTLLYFPMIFLNHGLHLYIECFHQPLYHCESKMECRVNFLPCSEDMRESVIKLFIQCLVDLQNPDLQWSICGLNKLNAGPWTRVNWDLKAQKILVNTQSMSKGSQPQQKKNDNKTVQNKDIEMKPMSDIIEVRVRRIISKQEKNCNQRTLSVGWVNSSINKKTIIKIVTTMISEDVPKLATCSYRPGNNVTFNRVDLLPSKDESREDVLRVFFGELVCSVMDDTTFELKEVMDLPPSEGRYTWRYLSLS